MGRREREDPRRRGKEIRQIRRIRRNFPASPEVQGDEEEGREEEGWRPAEDTDFGGMDDEESKANGDRPKALRAKGQSRCGRAVGRAGAEEGEEEEEGGEDEESISR